MALPCAPSVPMLPGAVNPLVPTLPQPPPPQTLPIGNIVAVVPDPTQEQNAPPVPQVALPRFVSEFPLGKPHVLYWLATLCRASYSPTSAFMQQAVQAVLPGTTPVTFVANSTGQLTPGYTIIKLPMGAIVVVSGTTNLGQWMDQIFNSYLTEWFSPLPANLPYKMQTLPIYYNAANTILAALANVVPNDQQILWVGHSMGGAIAQLLHATCTAGVNERTPSRCCTFAAPKFGDRRAAANARSGSQVFRAYITDTDFVPSLPPDLTIFNVAIPQPLQAYSNNWANFRRPGVLYAVAGDGTIDTADEPSIYLQVAAAVLAAGVGAPIALGATHQMQTFVARFYNSIGSASDPAPTNWNDPTQITRVNANLTAAGL